VYDPRRPRRRFRVRLLHSSASSADPSQVDPGPGVTPDGRVRHATGSIRSTRSTVPAYRARVQKTVRPPHPWSKTGAAGAPYLSLRFFQAARFAYLRTFPRRINPAAAASTPESPRSARLEGSGTGEVVEVMSTR
jgi:hypothetical protein